MKRALVILVFWICSLHAAFELASSNVFSGGMSGNFMANNDFFSAYLVNPASSFYNQDLYLGINYFRPYNLPGLNAAGVYSLVPLNAFGSGVSLVTLGNRLYQEVKATGNISRSFFHQTFSVGLNGNWYQINVQNYHSTNSFGIDFGVVYKINNQLTTGFSIQNFAQARLNGYLDEIPLVTSWGFVFQPGMGFSTYLSISKDAGFPASLQVGFNFKANSSLSIQSAFSSYPAVPSLGFRFSRKWVSINYLFQYHFELGATHFWGVSFRKRGLRK